MGLKNISKWSLGNSFKPHPITLMRYKYSNSDFFIMVPHLVKIIAIFFDMGTFSKKILYFTIERQHYNCKEQIL